MDVKYYRPPTPWNAERDAFLIAMHGQEEEPSFSIMAAKINDEFGTAFTRNSLIGRSRRLDLAKRIYKANSRFAKQTVPRKPRQAPKPRQRFSNGSKRMITIFESIEQIELHCAEIEPLNISLVDLEAGQCRWPYGELPAGILFCGHDQHSYSNNGADVTSSYCICHYALSKRRMT